MNLTGNTILITGGGSGIGLALAEKLSKLDNQVIVAGRSLEKLKVVENKGLKTVSADMSDSGSIQALAKKVTKDFPKTNVVVHNAGICKLEDLVRGGNSKVQEETIATNFLGPMRLTDALLPHLLKQNSAMIMTVSSGLAFVPSAFYPTYSATKAALHSYSQSLRFQLKDTSVKVIEIVPPYVQTQLGGEFQATDPNAMPLKNFISEVMQILKSDPQVEEVLVKRVHPHRFAAENGREKYDAFFRQYNARFVASGNLRSSNVNSMFARHDLFSKGLANKPVTPAAR
jgi:uncharacterized oxidoreductase